MIELIIAFSVPSSITGFLFWLLKRHIDKTENKRAEREERQEERDKKREQLMLLIMQTSRATNVLAEATARAVQRIPDAKCNGDMKAALEAATEIQNKEKDFLLNQGIEHIFGTTAQ